jgi:hypothetical protein
MERRTADIKVLWSNLHKGVRTFYISFTRPKETFFSYKLLATLSKRVKELADLNDIESKYLLKVLVNRYPSKREIAYALVPLSLNLIGKSVLKNPNYGVFSAAIEGFRKPRPISFSLTVSKESYVEYIRPLIITMNPGASSSLMKRHAREVASRLWEIAVRELSPLNGRYLMLDSVNLISPLAVIALTTKGRSVEEIKAVLSDGGEYREVRIPVRKPEWKLNDLPATIIDDIKTSIVEPLRKGMSFATKGAFLTGPPGVGKSVMAEALADSLGLKVVELRPQTYRSMWYGATERTLNAIFKEIVKKRKHIALIIDDAEFLSSRKYTMHEAHISEISTILYHLQRPDRPFTILTANNPDLIDPAILRPGRIDVTVVMGYPDRKMRMKAILRNSQRYGISFRDEKVLNKMVEITKWFTLAEVDALLRLAASKGGGRIGHEDLEWGRKKFNVNVSERISLQDYLRWWSRKTQGIVITYIPTESEI